MTSHRAFSRRFLRLLLRARPEWKSFSCGFATLPVSSGMVLIYPKAARTKGNRSAMPLLRLCLLSVIFISYALLLGFGITHHEPWFDEAQAWLLARDSTPLDLINRHLRYEGSPGLWHFILSIFAKSGLPYQSVALVAAFFALTGLYTRRPFCASEAEL